METPVKLSALVIKYHSSAKNWASDLDFFKVEGIFFHRLLAAYFIRLSAPQFSQQLRDLEAELAEIEGDRCQVDKLLREHVNQMGLVTEDMIRENPEDLEVKHIRLGYLITALMHKFRHTKRKLFALVEEVVKDDALF